MLYKVVYRYKSVYKHIYCFGIGRVEKVIQSSCNDRSLIFDRIELLDFSFKTLKKCIKKVVEEKDA